MAATVLDGKKWSGLVDRRRSILMRIRRMTVGTEPDRRAKRDFVPLANLPRRQ